VRSQIVDAALTPSRRGAVLPSADGTVRKRGDAHLTGRAPSSLAAPAVAIAHSGR
jgi:hypothetical protein